ncbi:MAG TPA: HD domain-containing phosphohydrolase [Thermomicrobiaceae bacterium]|nr:HD domain-containing phosphohydrolase [Thermomicrobiaceae bacterium]
MVSGRQWAAWWALGALPLMLFALLRARLLPDPLWAGATFHFYVVSFTALVAIVLAVLMRLAAGQLRDPRVLLLSLAFLSIAGIFLTHALTTPGVLVGGNPWVGFSARFSLFAGGLLLAGAALSWQPRLRRVIAAHQTLLTALCAAVLLAYGAVALGSALHESPAEDAEYAMPGMSMPAADPYAAYGAATTPAADAPSSFIEQLNTPLISWSLGGLTLALLGLGILRFLRIQRQTPSPLAAGFLASSILLTQSQFVMLLGDTWHASWWEYHVLMLAAFAAAIAGLAREYATSGSLAGIVGSLFLRETITGLERGYTDVIVALVEAVEAKDPYTRGHTQRVAELSVLIGQELGLPAEELRTLNQAAMLHDIGKIGIPDDVLHKPGPLTMEEFAVIQEHPVRGYQIIRRVRSLQAELSGVRSHHERLDGSGYPDGLRGEAIPLQARIIAVADVFDALTSHRPYRTAWPVERALAIIDQDAGSKLDPGCVAALHRVLQVWAQAHPTGHLRLAS